MIRHKVLVVDYDGTIAHNGAVSDSTIAALRRVKSSGRTLILCTGRQIRFLAPHFPTLEIFDIVVAENGGTLYFPETREEVLLVDPPNQDFVRALERRGIDISIGKTIVATWEPNDKPVLEEIRNLGLELHVIFNKGAVMVLPSSVNKATGLAAALKECKLSPHNAVGVGDAENDHAFLKLCETSAAVANALAALKSNVDYVLSKDHGHGVEELIAKLLHDDLQSLKTNERQKIRVGRMDSGEEVSIPLPCGNLLVIGASGSGKSAFTSGFLQGLLDRAYQIAVVDPEGDYEHFDGILTFGDGKLPPSIDQTIEALKDPDESTIANLLALKVDRRPEFLMRLLPALHGLRAKYGRPHWIVVDEAHHMLSKAETNEKDLQPLIRDSLLFVTVHPERLAKPVLDSVKTVVAIGDKAEQAVRDLFTALGRGDAVQDQIHHGEALVFTLGGELKKFTLEPAARFHFRHRRKYTEGNLPDERSFIFRGPGNQLKLKANNLQLFLQISEGVDDETWRYHLKRHEYSNWFRDEIKDPELGREVRSIEEDNLSAAESRERIRAAVEKYYVLTR